jgi:hypothetical protein
MEPVKIEPYRTLREGIEFAFRGAAPDEDGLPGPDLFEIDLVVPPLNFDSIKALQARLEKFNGGVGIEAMDTVRVALNHALRRNYRGVPDWLIGQTVDPANMLDMFVALMDLSGLKRKEIEEGKAKAALAASSAGTTFTST